MERLSMLPRDWLNRMVMVEAYSGEERSHTTDTDGIGGVSHVMARRYVGRLADVNPAGVILVLKNERRLFLSASAVLSVEPVEAPEEQ